MHSMSFNLHQDCTLLNVWDLAYFYLEFMDDNVEFYESKVHVKLWRFLTLEPFNVPHVPKH
jgi:hypothetical protein